MSELEFDACFKAHFGRLIGLGRAISGDLELARDIAQETFLRLHSRWDQLNDRGDVSGWLTRVMANLLIDHYRSAEAERQAVARLRDRRSDSTASGEPRIDTWAELIEGLPPRQRVIVTLHYGNDLSIDEIARMIEVSPNTVKSALSKARSALRSQGELDGR